MDTIHQRGFSNRVVSISLSTDNNPIRVGDQKSEFWAISSHHVTGWWCHDSHFQGADYLTT